LLVVGATSSDMDLLTNSTLRYTPNDVPGFTRVRKGKGFAFLSEDKQPVEDEQIKKRLKLLAIPPAWQSVWISPFPNGHLQVTGIDEKGRKQYIYHPEWNRLREENKFTRILTFGKELPKLRKAIAKDLRKRQLDKAKVTAIALNLMEETLIRPGNAQYRNVYHSFGLTTLRNRHVRINGKQIFFRFVGKKGKLHQIKVSDRSLAKKLKDVMEIPGQELFQYYNERAEICTLDSGDLNTYIKQYTSEQFSSKDFRTWYGTVWAFYYLSRLEAFQTKSVCKHNINACLDFVAKKLGNTRTVCRQYYVSNSLLEAYEQNRLQPYLTKMLQSKSKLPDEKKAEKFLIQFLKSVESV